MITSRKPTASKSKKKVFAFYSTVSNINREHLVCYLSDVTPILSFSYSLCLTSSILGYQGLPYIMRERERQKLSERRKGEKM